MEKRALNDTACYAGEWKANLPHGPTKSKKGQSLWRLKGSPAFMKAVVDANTMKVEFKVVDTLGSFANAEFVDWAGGDSFGEEPATLAAQKAETCEVNHVDNWNSSLGIYRVRKRLISFVQPPRAGMSVVEAKAARKKANEMIAGSPSKPASGKHKREDAQEDLEFLPYKTRVLPVLERLAKVAKSVSEQLEKDGRASTRPNCRFRRGKSEARRAGRFLVALGEILE